MRLVELEVCGMTPKQRVNACLRRQPADRVPIFMWFHPETAVRLAALLEIPPSRVGEAMGDDFRQAWVNNNYAMEGIVHEHEGETHTDAWGISWVKQGAFNQISHHPLADATEQEVLAYRQPVDHIEELLSSMTGVVKGRGEYFLGCDVSPCVFELYWRLRGMDGALLDLLAEPEMANALLAGCADLAALLAEEACKRFDLDWLWTGDDVAGQQSMMISPRLWKAMVAPHLARVISVGKAHGLPVAYHSCGAVRPIIPGLIEIGVDVLNPVQCKCPGMDPIDLKREFGSDLAFMGGVDTQELLPQGTAAEVRNATARLIEGMTSDGGGYILAASHTVPPDTPVDNIFAMYEAAGVSRQEIFDHAAQIRKGTVA